MNEINICIKNSETKMAERHFILEGVHFNKDDPFLKALVNKAMMKFRSASDVADDDYEIVVKGKLVWQS